MTDAMAESVAYGLPVEKLAALRQRIEEQLKMLEEAQRKLVTDEEQVKLSKNRPVPLLLKVGGQGYRLWKAAHEVLVTEISSRTPPEGVAPPVVRGESQRFQVCSLDFVFCSSLICVSFSSG
jgi:hypothetical protein